MDRIRYREVGERTRQGSEGESAWLRAPGNRVWRLTYLGVSSCADAWRGSAAVDGEPMLGTAAPCYWDVTGWTSDLRVPGQPKHPTLRMQSNLVLGDASKNPPPAASGSPGVRVVVLGMSAMGGCECTLSLSLPPPPPLSIVSAPPQHRNAARASPESCSIAAASPPHRSNIAAASPERRRIAAASPPQRSNIAAPPHRHRIALPRRAAAQVPDAAPPTQSPRGCDLARPSAHDPGAGAVRQSQWSARARSLSHWRQQHPAPPAVTRSVAPQWRTVGKNQTAQCPSIYGRGYNLYNASNGLAY